ncbi:MAG: tetraacyldisaccharide 4'-kinase [Bacteroidetes bacterium]|nr:tetraacyldisaccharide 4'-kinase [Bacteroidota bacterium]
MQLLQYILYPFSLLYGFVMQARNLLFDLRILPSARFEKAVISVGNLSMGGTGKTPHIEYLIRLLSPLYSLATLSRGYGRESKGFIIGSKRSNVKYLGDEPLQLIRKFGDIRVAVDENRKRGITNLLNKYEDLDVILLDDAFQHRYVRPGLSILLTTNSSLYTEDHVVPSGTLREFRQGARRADIIIITKTPKIFSPISRRRILDEISPQKHQQVYFSYITYGEPVPLSESGPSGFPLKLASILLLTGIADHSLLQEHIERICSNIVVMGFGDHHVFNENDIHEIETRFNDIPSRKKVIITTEKDAMRLRTPELLPALKNLPVFYIPISVEFHGKDKDLFDSHILSFISKTKTSL